MVELSPLMKKVAGNIKGDTPKVVETRASQERRWKKSESQKPNRPNIQQTQPQQELDVPETPIVKTVSEKIKNTPFEKNKNINKVLKTVDKTYKENRFQENIKRNIPDTYKEPSKWTTKLKVYYKDSDKVVFVNPGNLQNFLSTNKKPISKITTSPGRGQPEVIWRQPTDIEVQTAFQKASSLQPGYVPQYYRENINAPVELVEQGLITEEEFEEIGFKSSVGIISKEEADRILNEKIQSNITPDWFRKYGTVETKKGTLTWKRFKKENPSFYIGKNVGGGISINEDVVRWKSEKHKKAEKEGDFLYLAGEFFSPILSPERWEYAIEDLQGKTSVKAAQIAYSKYGSKTTSQDVFKAKSDIFKQAEAKGIYEYKTAFDNKDVLKVVGRALSTPLPNIAMGYGTGLAFGIGTSAVTSGLMTRANITATTTALKAWQGGQLAVGGVMLYKTGENIVNEFKKDQTKGILSLMNTAVLFGFMAKGFSTGSNIKIRRYTPSQWGSRYSFKRTLNKFEGDKTITQKWNIKKWSTDPKTGMPKLKKVGEFEAGWRSISHEQAKVMRNLFEAGWKLKGEVVPSKTSLRIRMMERLGRPKEIFSRANVLKGKTRLQKGTANLSSDLKLELYGSLTKGKGQDVDLLAGWRSLAKTLRVTEYAEKVNPMKGKIYDVHFKPRVGTQTTWLGNRKLPSIDVYGQKTMSWYETAVRRTDSSLLLANEGRVKDIGRSILDWVDVINAAGKSSDKGIQKLIYDYAGLARQWEKNPLVMSKYQESMFYNKMTVADYLASGYNKILTKIRPNQVKSEYISYFGETIPKFSSSPPTLGMTGFELSSSTFTAGGSMYVSNVLQTSKRYTSPISVSFARSSFSSSFYKSPKISSSSRSISPSRSISSVKSSSSSSNSISSSRSISTNFSSSASSKSVSSSIVPSSSSVSSSISSSISPSSVSSSSSRSSSSSSISSIPSGYGWLPPMGMGGRGRRGYSPGKLSKKYRFRKFNIPTIGGLKI